MFLEGESATAGIELRALDDSDARWLVAFTHEEKAAELIASAIEKSPLGGAGPVELLEAIDNAIVGNATHPLGSAVAARLEGDELHVAQCGTARAFLIDDAVTELSQVQTFELSARSGRDIYSGLGLMRSRPIFESVPVAEGDLLVVVDDTVMLHGGHGPLVKDDLVQVTRERAPQDAARAIVAAARGGSALVVRFSEL